MAAMLHGNVAYEQREEDLGAVCGGPGVSAASTACGIFCPPALAFFLLERIEVAAIGFSRARRPAGDRAALFGALQRCCRRKARDLGMVSRRAHVGHLPAAIFGRSL
jgi:hypothetical protein